VVIGWGHRGAAHRAPRETLATLLDHLIGASEE
jgi:hypothetical protein